MSKQDLWMPLYIADYLADTMHLTAEEHGAYLLIIIHYWRNGGAIKNDKKTLKIIAKISSKKLENVLPFFYEKNGYLHHKRIDEELAKAAENKEKQKKRTEAATLARQQRYVDVTSNVTFTPSPSPSPSSSLRSEEKTEEDKSSSVNSVKEKNSVEAPASSASELTVKAKPVMYPQDFERFWLAYPAYRRKEKPQALAEWRKALKKADVVKIIAAAEAFCSSKEAIEGFAPYPAKWLKGERFNEESQPVQSNQAVDDRQKAENLKYLRDTLQKPLDNQQAAWLTAFESQKQGGRLNG